MNLGDPGSPIEITKDNALSFIEECARVLEEQAVPEPHYILLPKPWYTPHRSRGGRLAKKRIQRKVVPLYFIMKGRRWRHLRSENEP